MSDTSKSELSRLLGDELGEEAYRLDTLSRWPSLRVLDFLFSEGRSTTGEIARGVNMDMREIRGTVESLSEVGILEEVEEDGTSYWVPTSQKFLISVENRNGLALELETETPEPVTHQNNSSGPETGLFSSIGAKIDRLFRILR